MHDGDLFHHGSATSIQGQEIADRIDYDNEPINEQYYQSVDENNYLNINESGQFQLPQIGKKVSSTTKNT